MLEIELTKKKTKKFQNWTCTTGAERILGDQDGGYAGVVLGGRLRNASMGVCCSDSLRKWFLISIIKFTRIDNYT